MNNVSGFLASGVSSGIKKKNKMDLALIYSERPAKVSAFFTENIVKAAPIVIGIDRIKNGLCQAIIVNSGNANACTGEKGIRNAEDICSFLARNLKIDKSLVIPSSTGVIGTQLPVQIIKKAIPSLIKNLKYDGINDFSNAILTTDQFPKLSSRKISIGSKAGRIIAIGKGAGMIAPNMATMLCFIITDINISRAAMNRALRNSVEDSFNKIIVDGDTSTNDSVFLLANGELDNNEINLKSVYYKIFEKALTQVNTDISKMIVKDGEGATKVVTIEVKGAKSTRDANKIARTIGNSLLVKTALFGEDANWGRFIAAAGRAGVKFDYSKADLFFNNIKAFSNGVQSSHESKFSHIFKKPAFKVTLKLREGAASSFVITSDLTPDYIKINADYRT